MIKASEARARAAENKIKNIINDTDALIRKAVTKGRTDINILCPDEATADVEEAFINEGYAVVKTKNGLKISWG